MKNLITYLLIVITCNVYGQRGTPYDAYDYQGDPWSTGNLIFWALILLVLGYSAVKSLGKAEAEKEMREKNISGSSFFNVPNYSNESPPVYTQKAQVEESIATPIKPVEKVKPSNIQTTDPAPEKIKYLDNSDKYQAAEVCVEFLANRGESVRGLLGKNAVISHSKYASWVIDYEVAPYYNAISSHTQLRYIWGQRGMFEVLESDLFVQEKPVETVEMVREGEDLLFTQVTVNSNVFGKSFIDCSTKEIVRAPFYTKRINLIFKDVRKKD